MSYQIRILIHDAGLEVVYIYLDLGHMQVDILIRKGGIYIYTYIIITVNFVTFQIYQIYSYTFYMHDV